jgi:hypothetical protein
MKGLPPGWWIIPAAILAVPIWCGLLCLAETTIAFILEIVR